jgi:hypothetical protein
MAEPVTARSSLRSSEPPRLASVGRVWHALVLRGRCATSPGRRGTRDLPRGKVPPALRYRGCRGLRGTCPRDPSSALPGAACTPVPPPPSAPPARHPGPRGPVCAEDSGLTETLVDSRPPKSPLSPKFPRSFRTTGSRACPWFGERVRGAGHRRSHVDRGFDGQAAGTVGTVPSPGSGCHGSAPEGGCVRPVNRVVAATMSSGACRCGNDVVGAGPVVPWSVPRSPASPTITWSARLR